MVPALKRIVAHFHNDPDWAAVNFDQLQKAMETQRGRKSRIRVPSWDEVKKQLGNDGTEITPGTPEDYAEFIDKDEKKWSQLVKTSGVEQE